MIKDEVFIIESDNYKIWYKEGVSEHIVLYLYPYGGHLEDPKVNVIAESILSKYNDIVITIKYYGSTLKYSEKSIQTLESELPAFLKRIKHHLNSSYQNKIEENRFQDVIKDLYFDAFSNYLVDLNSIIPVFGDDEYQDFGVIPALGIIDIINKLKKTHTDWPWEFLVGTGAGYGGFLIEMINKIRPQMFSTSVILDGLIYPSADDIFVNYTEWQFGHYKKYQRKAIGKLNVCLVEKEGWTTNMNHQFAFKPEHFDIRNLDDQYYSLIGSRLYGVTNKNIELENFVKDNKIPSIYKNNLSIEELYFSINADVKEVSQYNLDYSIHEVTGGVYFFSNLISCSEYAFLNYDELNNSTQISSNSKLNSIIEKYGSEWIKMLKMNRNIVDVRYTKLIDGS